MSIGQIVKECIGKDVQVLKSPVRPGDTNHDYDEDEVVRPERITGDNTEDKVPNERAA
ncbi:MAG: hypothetical protein J6B39_01470 [Lachnospiraceae bacterium]|nr:hypothetical protein [Lachnospiraceae bacterium]